MRGTGIGDKLVALFLLAALLLSPPFLAIFAVPERLFGIPILFLYLFAGWGLLIFILARLSAPEGDAEAAVRETS